MKKPLVFAGFALALVFSVWMSNMALALISGQSTFDVALGFGLLVAVGLFLWMVGREATNQLQRVVFIAVILLGMSGSACTTIRPGHVGIVVYQWGTDKGVQSYPAVTGRVWYNPVSTDILEYPTFVKTVVWDAKVGDNDANEEITFSTADKMQVAADFSLSYYIEPTGVPAFYVKFRSEDLDHFTHGFLRNLARDEIVVAAGKYKIDAIMGDSSAFIAEARGLLQKALEPYKVKIEQFGFVGAPRPPASVTESINATTKATQDAIRIENELRQSRAQAAKAIADAEGQAASEIARAEGRAKANRVLADSISDKLLEWRRMDAQQQAIARWNGGMPTYMGGAPIPFIQLDKK